MIACSSKALALSSTHVRGLAWPRLPVCRLIESDAEALAGQTTTWVPPDKFERVTRSEWPACCLLPAPVPSQVLPVLR